MNDKSLTIDKAKGWFNEFSNMPAIQLVELLSSHLKKSNQDEFDCAMIAEISRALFVSCSYVAAMKSGVGKNDEMCRFYSEVLSKIYGNECRI